MSTSDAWWSDEPAADEPAAEPVTITVPGIYEMSDADYHRDPVEGGSLSNTEARRVLECPAKYKWFKEHQEHKATFEFGHAAHRQVLGIGAAIAVCDFPDWRTKDARDARAAARADGASPVLAHEWETVQAMVEAIEAHPIAHRLLTAAGGKSEQAMFWRDVDPFTGRSVWLRSRLDRLPAVPTTTGRMIVADYKTAANASGTAFSRAAASYGYHQQAAWYLDGIRALLERHAAFVFVIQEKTAPYLVNVVELDATALQIGRELNARALARWIECTDRGVWPGYAEDVQQVALPKWALMQSEEYLP